MAGGCCCSSSWSAFSFLHTKKNLFVCLFIFSAHQALKSTFPKQKMLIKMIQYKLKKMGKKKGNISVSRNLSLNTWQVCKTMKGGNMWKRLYDSWRFKICNCFGGVNPRYKNTLQMHKFGFIQVQMQEGSNLLPQCTSHFCMPRRGMLRGNIACIYLFSEQIEMCPVLCWGTAILPAFAYPMVAYGNVGSGAGV